MTLTPPRSTAPQDDAVHYAQGCDKRRVIQGPYLAQRLLSSALNDLGAALHIRGKYKEALSQYQEAVGILMGSLRCGSMTSEQDAVAEARRQQVRQMLENLRKEALQPTPMSLDMFPWNGAQYGELDAAFLPLSGPIEFNAQRQKQAQEHQGAQQALQEDDRKRLSATALFNMGLAHLRLCSVAKASELFDLALSIFPTASSSDPTLTARILTHAAIVQHAQGMQAEANSGLDQALRLYQEAVSVSSEDQQETQQEEMQRLREIECGTANVLSLLGRIRYLSGNQEQALELSCQALDLRRSVYSNSSPQVAASLYNIALVLHDMGCDNEAIENCALSASSLALSSMNVQCASHAAEASRLLGEICADHGHIEEAVTALLRAIKLRKSAHDGRPSPALCNDLVRLGGILQNCGRYRDAMVQFREALAVARTLFSPNDEFIVSMLSVIGNLHLERGETDEAAAQFAEAGRMQRVVHEMMQSEEGNGSVQDPIGHSPAQPQCLLIIPGLLQALNDFHPHAAAA